MEEDQGNQRELGRLSEAVRLLQETVHDLRIALEEIKTTLAEAKGGWRTLLWLGGAAGAVGTAIGSFLHEILSKLPGGHQ